MSMPAPELSPSLPAALDEARIDRLVDALVDSYDLRPVGSGLPLPSWEAVVSVVQSIRRVLFPGYYGDEMFPRASRHYHVGTWLCQLHGDLTRILRTSLAHDDPEALPREVAGRASDLSVRFLEALPSVRAQLLDDAQAALDGDPAASSIEEIVLTYPGFEAITIHRVAHWLHVNGVRFVPRAMSEHAHARTGIDIHPGATIGRRFFIDHGTGVVVGETSNIGDDVKLYQGVTLGALSVSRGLAGSKRHPTIEDGVVIYAGATVLGGETVIGRGAVIGGNVWITQSVEPGVTVIETAPVLDFRHRPNRTPEDRT